MPSNSIFKILSYASVGVFAGCSAGGGTTGCPAAPSLSIVGESMGSTPLQDGIATTAGPYPTAATYLYFSTSGQGPDDGNPLFLSGTTTLTASDGTSIVGGPIQPVFRYHLVSYAIFGYSASVAGLKPNLTYRVTLSSLAGNQGGCPYGSQNAGSFTTQ